MFPIYTSDRIARMLAWILCGFLFLSPAFGQCLLKPGTGLNLGATDNTRLKSVGENRMLFLFVDFPDAPANENAQQLYQSLVPFSQSWFTEVSYGTMKLTVTPIYQWFRMPRASTTYNFARGLTFELHKQYIGDAIAAANSSVDFSQYDGVYILASKDAAVPFSPTWVPNPGSGILADGVEMRHVVTLGADVRSAIPVYQWHVIHHETGHLMGLPDLYLYAGSDVHAPVGAWDNMGLISVGAHFTAWQKRKLGWLSDKDFACVTSATEQVNLSPLENSSGVRAAVVQLSQTKAIVAEVRRFTGQDARLCDEGLLVYTVDSSVASGSGPLVVQRAVSGSDPTKLNKCGSGYNATFDLGNGKPSSFRDNASGVVFDILGRTSDGGYTVRVTNPLPIRLFPAIASLIGAGAYGASRTVATGGWVEVYGRNFGTTARQWAGEDFVGSQAPSLLDGVRVTIDSRPASISYVSPGQLNVQVPENVPLGANQVVVSNGAAVTDAFIVTVAKNAPGLLAPASFTSDGKQYVAALFQDQAFVGPPNLIPGVVFRRAKAGDTLIMYGVGFGSTNPIVPAGQIAAQNAALPNVTMRLGNAPANLSFAGLVAGYVGLYQFNVVVPNGVGGDVALTMTLDGQALSQTLWIAIQ
jgi:uncharacterized protein (TIGR03437 family)